MGFWGWRPFVFGVFISVLVMGCTTQPNSTPENPPTISPEITLIVRPQTIIRATATPGLPFSTTNLPIDHMSTPVSSDPPPEMLSLPRPACYAVNAGDVLCLGLVENTSDEAVYGVRLLGELVNQAGDVVSAQRIALHQRIIPASDSAPYHVLFTDNATGLARDFGAVNLQPVDIMRVGRDNQSSPVTVTVDEHGVDAGRYVLGMTLHNNSSTPLHGVRVVVTLFDRAERVSGYRVREIEQLAGGAQMALAFAIVPQMLTSDLTYRIFVDY